MNMETCTLLHRHEIAVGRRCETPPFDVQAILTTLANWHSDTAIYVTLYVESYSMFREMITMNRNKNTEGTGPVRCKPSVKSGR